MKKPPLVFCVTLLFLIFVRPVDATVVSFDDITTGDDAVIYDYMGFTWVNMNVIHKDYFRKYYGIESGFENGVVSGEYVAVNSLARAATLTSGGDLFNFVGAFLSGAWNHGLDITVLGKLNGRKKYLQTVTVDADAGMWFEFDFYEINELEFTSADGLNAGFGWQGEHFVMDDFVFNTYSKTCVGRMLAAAGRMCNAYMRVYAKKMLDSDFDSNAALTKAALDFGYCWSKIETMATSDGVNCATTAAADIGNMIETRLEGLYIQISDGLNADDSAAQRLGKDLFAAVKKSLWKLFKAHRANIASPNMDKLNSSMAMADARFESNWHEAMDRAERGGAVYNGPPMVEVEELMHLLMNDIVKGL